MISNKQVRKLRKNGLTLNVEPFSFLVVTNLGADGEKMQPLISDKNLTITIVPDTRVRGSHFFDLATSSGPIFPIF